jgi:tRNA threonylcarbamoyladenosine biosynthesis protein TsaB
MRALGIDTATRIGSVGLVEDGCVVAECSAWAAPGHAETLAPVARRILADAGWSISTLDVVVISIGPGSFTGLRVGLSLGKGLAFGRDLALVPVSTLDALAEVAEAEPGELVCPILDARKGELYAALYEAAPPGLTKLSRDLLIRWEDLIRGVNRRCRFLGDGVERYGESLETALGATALVLPFTRYHPRGGVVARLGAAAHAAGGGEPLGPLEPRYVRAADAELRLAGASGEPARNSARGR